MSRLMQRALFEVNRVEPLVYVGYGSRCCGRRGRVVLFGAEGDEARSRDRAGNRVAMVRWALLTVERMASGDAVLTAIRELREARNEDICRHPCADRIGAVEQCLLGEPSARASDPISARVPHGSSHATRHHDPAPGMGQRLCRLVGSARICGVSGASRQGARRNDHRTKRSAATRRRASGRSRCRAQTARPAASDSARVAATVSALPPKFQS